MTEQTGRAEIEALLAERGRFETWLDQLSAKASTMPAHVVERVRADYQQRLDKVVADLLSQADSMRAEASTLEERVRVLEGDLAAKKDARAEDELRALVGEYDGGAWEAKAAEHDTGINAVESDRAENEANHRRLQQLLGEAARPARPATPVSSPVVEAPPPETRTVAEPTPTVTATAIPAEPVTPPPPPTAEPKPTAPTESGSHLATAKRPSPFDEIGFMRAVVGRTTPYAGTAFPSEEDLAPRQPTLTPTPEKASPAIPVEPAKVAPDEPPLRASAERKVVPSFEAPPIPDAPIVAPVRSSSPSIPMIADEGSIADALRPAATVPDAARSLKCQECGWMNYPTEWYCEKCGGELAAF